MDLDFRIFETNTFRLDTSKTKLYYRAKIWEAEVVGW